MAYEELIHSMEADAQLRVLEVQEGARGEIEEKREAARRQAAEIRERLLADAARRIEVERHQRLYRAREETKAGLARVREEYLRHAIELAGGRLGALRGADGYAGVLESLTREALEALGEPGARVRVDRRDEGAARAIVQDLPGQPLLIPDLDIAGGVIVESADGRIRVDNTFASRLARAGEVYRRELYDRLFGG
ncbi:MAG: V-type ATP synthase subunit E family protein [Methanospirillum sp.]